MSLPEVSASTEPVADLAAELADAALHTLTRSIVGAGVAVAIGTGLIPTHTMFGPSNADATVSLQRIVTLDTGIFDKVQIPNMRSPGGITLQLKGIPDKNSEGQALNNTDFAQLVGLFGDATQITKRVEADVLHRAQESALYGALGLEGLYWLGKLSAYSLRKRDPEAYQQLTESAHRLLPSRRNMALAMIVIGTVMADGAANAAITLPNLHQTAADKVVFGDTKISGAHMQGKVLPTILPPVVNMLKATSRFYDQAKQNTEATFTDQLDKIYHKTKGEIALLNFSDLHCNTNMARIISTVAKLFQADIAANAGDTAFSSSTWQNYCVQALHDRLQLDSPDTEQVDVEGNHDSPSTATIQKKLGEVVLQDKIVTVKGLDMLGADDPRISELNKPLHFKAADIVRVCGAIVTGMNECDQNIMADLTQRLASIAQDAKHRPLLLLHDPTDAKELAKTGLFTIALAGHTHEEDGPNVTTTADGTTSYEYTNGTTGAASKNQINFGPLKNSVFMTVFMIDRITTLPISYYLIRVDNDTTVHMSGQTPINVPCSQALFPPS
jgi:predicted MPP superfamily phosphohydrolase